MEFRILIGCLLVFGSCNKVKFKSNNFIFNSATTGEKELLFSSHDDLLFTFLYQDNPLYLRQEPEDSVYGMWTFDETVGDVFDSKKSYDLAGIIEKEKGKYFFSGSLYSYYNNEKLPDVFTLKQN